MTLPGLVAVGLDVSAASAGGEIQVSIAFLLAQGALEKTDIDILRALPKTEGALTWCACPLSPVLALLSRPEAVGLHSLAGTPPSALGLAANWVVALHAVDGASRVSRVRSVPDVGVSHCVALPRGRIAPLSSDSRYDILEVGARNCPEHRARRQGRPCPVALREAGGDPFTSIARASARAKTRVVACAPSGIVTEDQQSPILGEARTGAGGSWTWTTCSRHNRWARPARHQQRHPHESNQHPPTVTSAHRDIKPANQSGHTHQLLSAKALQRHATAAASNRQSRVDAAEKLRSGAEGRDLVAGLENLRTHNVSAGVDVPVAPCRAKCARRAQAPRRATSPRSSAP